MPHVLYEPLDGICSNALEESLNELVRTRGAMDLNVVSVATAKTALLAHSKEVGAKIDPHNKDHINAYNVMRKSRRRVISCRARATLRKSVTPYQACRARAGRAAFSTMVDGDLHQACLARAVQLQPPPSHARYAAMRTDDRGVPVYIANTDLEWSSTPTQPWQPHASPPTQAAPTPHAPPRARHINCSPSERLNWTRCDGRTWVVIGISTLGHHVIVYWN